MMTSGQERHRRHLSQPSDAGTEEAGRAEGGGSLCRSSRKDFPLSVELPNEPPVLSPCGADALLRLLRRAAEGRAALDASGQDVADREERNAERCGMRSMVGSRRKTSKIRTPRGTGS